MLKKKKKMALFKARFHICGWRRSLTNSFFILLMPLWMLLSSFACKPYSFFRQRGFTLLLCWSFINHSLLHNSFNSAEKLFRSGRVSTISTSILSPEMFLCFQGICCLIWRSFFMFLDERWTKSSWLCAFKLLIHKSSQTWQLLGWYNLHNKNQKDQNN